MCVCVENDRKEFSLAFDSALLFDEWDVAIAVVGSFKTV